MVVDSIIANWEVLLIILIEPFTVSVVFAVNDVDEFTPIPTWSVIIPLPTTYKAISLVERIVSEVPTYKQLEIVKP